MTHNTSTQGCGSRTPEGAIYYPWHSGPSRHLKLPWVGPLLARPGQMPWAPLLGQMPWVRLLGPDQGLGRGQPLSTPGTALKKTGDCAHLAGLWRDLPVCPSGSHDLPHFFSFGKSGRKGQSRKMAPRAPPPELDWWRMGLVLPRIGALMISGTPPWPSLQGPPLTHGRGARPGVVHKVVRA